MQLFWLEDILVSQLISVIVSDLYFNVIEDALLFLVIGAERVAEDIELLKKI